MARSLMSRKMYKYRNTHKYPYYKLQTEDIYIELEFFRFSNCELITFNVSVNINIYGFGYF